MIIPIDMIPSLWLWLMWFIVMLLFEVATLYALYQSASKRKMWWFIAIIVFNFIAAVIYLGLFNKKGRR